MDICSCHHVEYGKQVCWGTKEMEECSCGGDESKCNFYPDKRVKANEKNAPTDICGVLKKLIDKGYELCIYPSPGCLSRNDLRLQMFNGNRKQRIGTCKNIYLNRLARVDPNDILVKAINEMIDALDNCTLGFDEDFRDYSGLLD